MLKSFVQIGFALCLWILPGLAHAQKLERAVLAYGSTGPNLTPFWVAREAGLHRHYGLDVDVVFFRGSTIAINALATRDAHFGSFGASSSVLARIGGIDTVLIATATPGLLFYLVTRKEIRNGNDLKGKKIAVSRPGTDSDLAARVAVQKLGLAEKDVQIISMGTDAERIVGHDPANRRCHSVDHWRLCGGAKTRLSLDIGSFPGQCSLRSSFADYHSHTYQREY